MSHVHGRKGKQPTADFRAFRVSLRVLKSFSFELWHHSHFFSQDQNKTLSKLINILLFAQGKAQSVTKYTADI